MLKVHEIFESISGEAGGFPQGTWCTFVRLQGCNLRCSWCDTKRAQMMLECKGKSVRIPELNQDHGPVITKMDIPEIAERCVNRHVLITGGEPLVQAETVDLIKDLLRKGHKVQVETNGSLPIPQIKWAHWVIDYKCPSSGMVEKMPTIDVFAERITEATSRYYGGDACIKWVIADEHDLRFAIERIRQLLFTHRCVVPHYLSPINGDGNMIKEMVAEIRGNNAGKLLDYVAFSIQIHKLFGLS